ncbi:MAG TPA: xanthine dehydrogenase family protein molybdopterin-binding subunit [Candidatus Binataceae bacterium]|nr:xanthine dehydrogenase family protein molybdopterin-binding subunit [Candidatus Binataceae bacterium]
MSRHKFIGERLKRREDSRLLLGAATYTDDLRLPSMLFAAILRSPHAHARLEAIDTSAARALAGVAAVVIGDDLKSLGSVPCAIPLERTPHHPVLAIERVRYVGEPVAAVVANSPEVANDALDLIHPEYEPLAAVVDAEKALAPDAVVIHEQLDSNVAHLTTMASSAVEAAMREADRVVSLRLVNQRITSLPIEPRGVLASFNRGAGRLTVWSSTQMPHLLRSHLAAMLHFPEHRLTVIAPEVGGGFGCKGNVYGEEALIAWLAMELGHPVKWIENRRENLASTTHGRDIVTFIDAAVKRDGAILALRARGISDVGAYLQFFTPVIAMQPMPMLTGAYRIAATAFEHRSVFTNKMSTDAYRGAGKPEACHAIECLMDEIAAGLEIDPVEIRRRNFIPAEAFPFRNAAGMVYDSGDYEKAFDKALELVDYPRERRRQAEMLRAGRYFGIGIASYVEASGTGPSYKFPPGMGGWESATVRIEPDGRVTVLTGVSPHGQGQETSFAQLVADELGIDPEDVVVEHGDTSMVQYGIGTFGSRGTSLGGSAMLMALTTLKTKLRKIAAVLTGWPESEMIFAERTIAIAGDAARSIPLARVIDAAYGFRTPIPGIEPGLLATSSFDPPALTCPFGTHIAVVEVDVETGMVKVLRYVAVDDCGPVINPMLVEGQIHGALAQGIAQALYEQIVYDDTGQLLTATLMDYTAPRASMLPRYELASTVTPTAVNPLGMKGIGQAGVVASTPCIVNAVVDALRPLGVRHIDLPLGPERVWRAIQAARNGS